MNIRNSNSAIIDLSVDIFLHLSQMQRLKTIFTITELQFINFS